MTTKRSVKKPPAYEESATGGFVLSIASIADDIIPWGTDTKSRDRRLREFWPSEPILSSAIYSVSTRNASFSWMLDGPRRTVTSTQDILTDADNGAGWLEFMYRWCVDYLTQDNGAFIEIVRANKSAESPCVAINHLDSGRCRRTGVPEWPVVYTDRLGQEHRLAPWQVVATAEMPSPIETMNGVGFCAVSRVLREAQLMRDIFIHDREKITGADPKRLYIVGNVAKKELQDALLTHKAQMLEKGYMRYIKPVLLPILDPKASASVATIDLATLPTGFDKDKELTWYITILAMAFGADYQDFAPLSTGALGSSQQSQVLHMKSKGKGPAMFMKTLAHIINFTGILPKSVNFDWDEQDTVGETEQATLSKLKAERYTTLVHSGVLTPEAVRQMMLDDGELDEEVFAMLQTQGDVTEDVTATDDEQVPEEVEIQPQGAGPQEPVITPPRGLKVIRDEGPSRHAEKLHMKLERDMAKGMERALKKAFGLFKTAILGEAKAITDVADILDDVDLWQAFQRIMLQQMLHDAPAVAAAVVGHNARMGLAINLDMVNPNILEYTRKFTNDWWRALETTTRESLREALVTWQESGLGKRGFPDLVASLEPTFGRVRAERIAATETTRLFDEANRIVERAAGVEQQRFDTAEDDIVCDMCWPHNGKVYGINEGPMPPLHVNCRCLRVGVGREI